MVGDEDDLAKLGSGVHAGDGKDARGQHGKKSPAKGHNVTPARLRQSRPAWHASVLSSADHLRWRRH